MSGIVFKQRFNPVASAKTPGLNMRHLQYIATRPGTVYNRGCGFGLWGRMPGQRRPEDIQNLESAKELLREASRHRTVYRAVISVGAKDAEQNGLYDRAAWERLARQHMAAIAKQMGIADKDFCYFVSMHQARGHPHIHIMYWDNGDQPRPEFMEKGHFERIAEAVRADWNRDICAEEISKSREAQGESSKELRTQLQAMCLEANPAKALDLQRLVLSPGMPGLANDLWKLVEELPLRGSLKYRYLPPEYKGRLNAFLDKVLDMPEVKGVYGQYLTATDALSAGYGNGEETTAENREKAVQKLYAQLGNEVMDAVREIASDLERSPPDTLPELLKLAESITPEMLRAQPSYRAVLQAMPTERVPTAQLYSLPAFRQELYHLVDDAIQHNPTLRGKLNGFIQQAAASSDEPAQVAKEIRSAFYRVVHQQAVSLLRSDAGYDEEMQRTETANTVQLLFRLLSQLSSQQQAQVRQSNPRRELSRQKSSEERKNIRAKMRQRGSWSQDFGDNEL